MPRTLSADLGLSLHAGAHTFRKRCCCLLCNQLAFCHLFPCLITFCCHVVAFLIGLMSHFAPGSQSGSAEPHICIAKKSIRQPADSSDHSISL